MELETSSLILLVLCGAISFGLGRTFVWFRDRRRAREQQARDALLQRSQRRAADEGESLNKAKRKRQARAQGGSGKR